MNNIADYVARDTVEILLFGYYKYMFAPLSKNLVLVSRLLKCIVVESV